MIDPITAFATAKAAFAGVQRLVNGGQEIQDVLGQLARWAQAAEDLKAWCGMESKPSIFKKLTFQNDTAHALQVLSIELRLQIKKKNCVSSLYTREPQMLGMILFKSAVISKEKEKQQYMNKCAVVRRLWKWPWPVL